MAQIYLSYSHKDKDFAHLLSAGLQATGHNIVIDTDALSPGQDWRLILSRALKSADALVCLISENSLNSQYTLMEIGTARGYSSEIGKPLIIPVLIDDSAIPLPLQDIQFIFAKDRNANLAVSEIERALSYQKGKEVARETKAEETARKIEANAATFIEDAIRAQKDSELKNSAYGKFWYLIGFFALLIGIAFALLSLRARSLEPSLIELATIVLTNVIVIGFLGACSRYAFSLGKAYTSESLKASDRLHAIAFGQFYLRAFGEKVTWDEMKEVFQHWNIDRSSTFSLLDAAQIDPQIIALIGQFASAISAKKKEKAY